MSDSDKGSSRRNNDKEIYELTLLGVSYIESKVYGNGEVAKTIEDSYEAVEITAAVTALATTFISMSALDHEMLPSTILGNIRKGLIALDGTTSEED